MKTLIAILSILMLCSVHAVTTATANAKTESPESTSTPTTAKQKPKVDKGSKSKAQKPVSKTELSPAKSQKHLTPEEEMFGKLTKDERLRLQVFLDRQQFAPGKVDGLAGEFTLKAARCWLMAGTDRSFETLLQAAHDMPFATTTAITVPSGAAKFIGEVPTSLEEKAAANRLPYTTLIEYLAERFHTDEATLARLNPHSDVNKMVIGDSFTVPNVIPFEIESPKLDPKAARLTDAQIRILHQQHMLEVRDANETLVASFPITVGSKPEHIRTGAWKVKSMAPNPTFNWDESMLKNGVASDKQYLLPPGPNNPVGVLWLELQPVKGPEAHIGIHGTNDPTHIGRNHSSGCIRLANWDIVRLARIIGQGTRVAWKADESATIVASVAK